MSFCTIDLDEERLLTGTLQTLSRCPDLYRALIERSSSNRGWHLTLYCNVECDKCRQRWDDPVRYKADRQRPPWARDVLFDSKERHYPEAGIVIRSTKRGQNKL